MGLTYAPGDLSFYRLTEPKEVQGMLGVYVDDTLNAGTESFVKATDKISEEFNSGPKEFPLLLCAAVTNSPDAFG